MAEVRPWVGSEISLGRFITLKNVKLVDCSKFYDGRIPLIPNPDIETLERGIWTSIDLAFSEPITTSDYTPDYVPTQIIAEFFKTNKFDGLKFKSKLGPGFNIVLFDIDVAELTRCDLFKAKEINFVFEIIENATYVTPYGAYLERQKNPNEANSVDAERARG